MPVVDALLNNGFNLRQAISWLVSKDQITPEQQDKAYHAIATRRLREAKKAAKPCLTQP